MDDVMPPTVQTSGSASNLATTTSTSTVPEDFSAATATDLTCADVPEDAADEEVTESVSTIVHTADG